MILLVAGTKEVREGLTFLISEKGYKVTAIDCGDELWKIVPFRRPSLVILDCSLDQDFKILARLRRDHRADPIPVLVFSADEKDLRDQALLHGADAYVGKASLDWTRLLSEIRRLADLPKKKDSEE